MKERRNKVDEVSWIDDDDDFLDLSEQWSGPEPESALDMHLKASLTEPHEPEPEYGDDLEDHDEVLVEEYEARAIQDFDDLTEDEWTREFEFDFDALTEKKLLDFIYRGPDWAREKEME